MYIAIICIYIYLYITNFCMYSKELLRCNCLVVKTSGLINILDKNTFYAPYTYTYIYLRIRTPHASKLQIYI